jgi:hypothetical protein
VDGTAELRQLAHLLRVGANTAREIASVRKVSATEIYSLADQADVMAEDLERIAATPASDAAPRAMKVSRH